MNNTPHPAPLTRRRFIVTTAAAAAVPSLLTAQEATSQPSSSTLVQPPAGRRILLSPKLGMIPKELNGKALSLTNRLSLAREAGFDGVDFDEAGDWTPEQVRAAVQTSGVFVHNAINHAHWSQRLTSANASERAKGSENIAHCLRVSHAAGGSGVLIVVGSADDGPDEVIVERCRTEIRGLIPLAASLGQLILIENVWNRMFYDHDQPPEQSAQRFVEFIDSFNSPWVGMYFDIGNHWKYGQPHEWIRALGRRCVKLDVKGFSRANDRFTDITEGDIPWTRVQQALKDIQFTGWATAEVSGGDLERLRKVREQMETALAL